MKKRLGIYIHIPFCASKCSYCDFYSLQGCDHLMPEYQEALLDHIAESSHSIRNYDVDSIYFGGGTPSFYGANRLIEILDELKLNGNVRLDSEVSLECNPDSISFNALKLLREEGFNRVSIGVQATDNNLLKLIGRRHNYLQARNAVNDARRAGFDNISVDLMYGLPSQTYKDWADSLAKIVELHPEHISAYALKLEPHTRMYKEYSGSSILPDEDMQADMYSYCVEMLERYGYKQYEISNFAVPGFESKHNLKYWNLDDYMSFGPGAHSCIGNLRYSYIKDIKEYIQGVRRNQSLVDEYEVIEPLERAVEYIMLGMRTVHGISELDYRTNCQTDWKPILQVLEAFKQKGWAEKTEDRWHFTVPGFLISNTLIGIMLETQASGRISGTPWITNEFKPLDISNLPKGEEELFAEMYEERMKS